MFQSVMSTLRRVSISFHLYLGQGEHFKPREEMVSVWIEENSNRNNTKNEKLNKPTKILSGKSHQHIVYFENKKLEIENKIKELNLLVTVKKKQCRREFDNTMKRPNF